LGANSLRPDLFDSKDVNIGSLSRTKRTTLQQAKSFCTWQTSSSIESSFSQDDEKLDRLAFLCSDGVRFCSSPFKG
jgi:hypothetical protein